MSTALVALTERMKKEIREGAELANRFKESELRLSTIINSAAYGIVTFDENGTIDEINLAGAATFSYAPSDLLGENIDQIIPKEWSQSQGKFTRQHLSSAELNAVESRQSLKGRRNNGSTFPIELSISEIVFRDKRMFVGLIKDISEKINLMSKKYRIDTIKSAIVEASLDALITVNTDGKILEFSPQASSVFGYSNEEAMGAYMAELIIPPQLREAHYNGMKRFLETREKRVSGQRIEILAIRKFGEEFPVELTVIPIEIEEETIFTAFIRDISNRKRSELELMEAKLAAETASKAKTRFLAHMSHEIRSPLNAVMGSLELLLDSDLNQEQKLYSTTALTSGRALLGVINDVLDFSKIEVNQMILEERNFSVHELVADVITLVDQRASEKDLDIGSYVDPLIPTKICGDSIRLRQILLNLADNAVKFSHSGGIAITVTINNQTSNRTELVFSVEDSGIGIPADKIDTIFEEFTRVDESDSARADGTGLGLAISKQLVDLMGGNIKLYSKVGKGSRFEFTLSFEIAESRNLSPDISLDIDITLVGFAKLASSSLSRQLEAFGCNVICRHSADHIPFAEQYLGRDRWVFINESSNVSNHILKVTQLRRAGYRVVLVSRLSSISLKRPELEFDHIMVRPLHYSVLLRLLQENECSLFDHRLDQHKDKLTSSADNKCILLAEDSPANQLIAEAILKKAGFDVEIAGNGLEAVRGFESTPPDLILMDLRMPEMDGIEATTQIRNLPGGTLIPIIGLSANIDQPDIDRCLAAGMNDFITKPFNPADLVRTIRSYLSIDKTMG